jgi:hypothetical protein
MHKAMTAYFNKVFRFIANKFNYYFEKHVNDIDGFYKDVFEKNMNRIITIQRRNINLDTIQNFKGTHIIRDPRDLLVSSYRYHQYCKEEWVLKPIKEHLIKRLKIKERGLEEYAKGKNYQDLLRSFNEEDGYLLELDLRGNLFQEMYDWDYTNPNMLELKYENIFGNEVEEFRKVLIHYGFNNSTVNKTLKFVEKHSFDKLKKKGSAGKNKHANIGKSNQWKEILPNNIKNKINSEWGHLITKLGYQLT